MIEPIALALGGLLVVMLATIAAQRTGLPSSVLLVLAGIGYGFLPGPNLELDPDLVLDVIIPPLLYAAALNSSLTAIRGSARAVVGLSVGLVLATALAVGFGLSGLVAVVPVGAAIAIGAAVAPPDPVAALSVGRKAGLPPRLVTLIEGEGLLNDATALTILQVAVAATVSGTFSVGGAVGQFALAAAGGVAAGLAVALVAARVRRWFEDALVDNALSLATPFIAYLVAEELHVSGVLAVVIAGLWLGHHNPVVQSSTSRLQTRAVWRLVEFLLEGYVFVLIGQQLPGVVRGLSEYEGSEVALAAGATAGIVLVLRPVWLYIVAHLPAHMHVRLGGDPDSGNAPLSLREVAALSWAGTRGVITLAAAFSLPAGFPARDLLLFCAYVVVLVTLVGQGLTFAPLLRRLRLRGAEVGQALVRNQARVAAVEAGLQRLSALAAEDADLAEATAPLRRAAEARHRRYAHRVELLIAAEDDDRLPVDDRYRSAVRARREMIGAEREQLLAWRDAGRLPDSDLRILERELDHEEIMLPGF